jgi:hypothetical protein
MTANPAPGWRKHPDHRITTEAVSARVLITFSVTTARA